jgi:hypothetical protein
MATWRDNVRFEKLMTVVPVPVASLDPTAPDGSVAPVTDDPDSLLYVHKAGVWQPVTGGTNSGSNLVTMEALTFPVDYNDVTAVDPTAGLVFNRQAEIDSFLLAAGTSNFKHLNAVFESIPMIIQHNVTVNLAAGVHRPRAVEPSGAAWAIPYKQFTSKDNSYALLTISGSAPSTWIPVDPALVGLAITGMSAPNSLDPWIDVAGTPFTGFNLKGVFAVLDTGQTCVIHKHTNSRLYLTRDTNPTPSSIVKIARPATVYRNSLDDLTTLHPYFGSSLFSPGIASTGWPQVQNVVMHPCSAYNFSFLGGWFSFLRSIYDQRFPGIPGYGNCLGGAINSSFWIDDSSIFAVGYGGVSIRGTDGYAYISSSYINGAGTGAYAGDGSMISLGGGVVFEACYEGISIEAAVFLAEQFDTTLKLHEVRNSTYSGLSLYGHSRTRVDYQAAVKFVDHAVPAIRIFSGSTLTQTGVSVTGNGLVDGGGNTDVGIEMTGPNASAVLDSINNVAGALGAVRMSDGEIWSWLDLKALGPVEDPDGNIVKKVS